MRPEREIRKALEDIERISRDMGPVSQKQEAELTGVYAALKWTLGEESGFDANLVVIRQILRAKAQ